MSDQPLLQVRDLVVEYPSRDGGAPVRAVDRVSFDLAAGTTLGLVGESGCGKSSCGRAVLGLTPAVGGEVWFDGVRLGEGGREAARHLRQGAQIVFQDPFSSLNPRLTVRQTLAEPLLLHRRCERRELTDRIAALLHQVGLDPAAADRYPAQFSGGQRQRIGIARALAVEPRLIVCDEPVSALDVTVQAQIVNLLMDLQERLQAAYLFIAHNLSVVRHISHRVAVMYLGRIVEEGTSDAVYSNPRHPYTQALLSAVPVPDPTARRQRIVLTGDVPSADQIPSGCRFHPRCPIAAERCAVEEPAAVDCGGGHRAACHFAADSPERMAAAQASAG